MQIVRPIEQSWRHVSATMEGMVYGNPRTHHGHSDAKVFNSRTSYNVESCVEAEADGDEGSSSEDGGDCNCLFASGVTRQ